MVEFGFEIIQGRQIDYDRNDFSLEKFILSREPSYAWCIGCGACSATCSTGNFTGFNIRKLNAYIKRGMLNGFLNDISKCMMCGKCILTCPRGVNTRNVILQIKNGLLKIKEDGK